MASVFRAIIAWFQHTATRRWLLNAIFTPSRHDSVSTHSRPKAAANGKEAPSAGWMVSTHSRPKAAACRESTSAPPIGGFNTQPPEGGCATLGLG